MRTELLREFVTLANYGNFHAAAEKLFVSQPTLSNHIKALESELGFELFDRTHNNELTAAGSILLDGVQSALLSIDTAVEDCHCLLATEPSLFSPVRLSVFALRDEIYSTLEEHCPCPYTYPKYEMRKPLLYDFVQDRTDIMCAYHLDRFAVLKAEIDQMGLCQAYFGKDTCAIAVKTSNPLAEGEMTRERLRGAEVAILSSSEFMYWKLFQLDLFGSDMDLVFRPFSIETPDNLRTFDLKDMVLVAPTIMINEFFTCRSDYVAHHAIDGEPLVISTSIVWRSRPDNPNIERVVELLQQHIQND